MSVARLFAMVILVVGATSCGLDGRVAGPREISDQARDYLDEVMDLMEAHSIRRTAIDWPAFRSEVIDAAGPALSISQTFPGIRKALELLGDGHSSYRSPTGTFIFVPTRTCQSSGSGPVVGIPEKVGYVRVGSFSGTAEQATAFAAEIQANIRAADRDDLIGWIVDLRGNGGGNMWPMIAGIGPVLGSGIVGWFINPSGAETSWEYRDGASWIGSNMIQRVDNPYTLKRPSPRVAVLVDNRVASSGEATFIAFKGRPHTRSFGEASCGLSTANAALGLSDGAILNLTVSVMADRSKTRYGNHVLPDEAVPEPAEMVSRAVAWLEAEAGSASITRGRSSR